MDSYRSEDFINIHFKCPIENKKVIQNLTNCTKKHE